MDSPLPSDRTYRIPHRNYGDLLAQLEKLNQRAAKLGCALIEIVDLGVEDTPDEISGFVKRCHLLQIKGEAPRINGWRLVAILQHVLDEVILRTVPGCEGVLGEEWREAEPRCEHCLTLRRRNDTFVLQNEAGEFKQVGRNCLRDFLGHDDPKALAGWAEIVTAIIGEAEESEESGDGQGWGHLLDLESYLEAVCAVIRTSGWTSRKHEQETGTRATAGLAIDVLTGWRTGAHDVRLESQPRDHELTLAAKEWGKGLKARADETGQTLSDYEHNLCVVANLSAIEPSMIGIAASLIPAYQRSQEQARERAQRPESQWVGEIGKRLTLKVEVVAVRELPGFRDRVTYLHKMTDEAGNDLVWFSTTGELNLGTHTLIATIKEHGEYRGRKQTTLSRCKEK